MYRINGAGEMRIVTSTVRFRYSTLQACSFTESTNHFRPKATDERHVATTAFDSFKIITTIGSQNETCLC
jgi:hypothetical protein